MGNTYLKLGYRHGKHIFSKCSYIDGLKVVRIENSEASENYLGKYYGDLNADSIKELSEFLFTHNGVGSPQGKVLSSFTKEEVSDKITHVIYSVSVIGGDFGVCDELRLFMSEYRVNKNTREIQLYTEKIKTVTGHCR